MPVIKVLIVDDDPDISGLIRRKLIKMEPGFDISVVDGGQDCVDYVGGKDVDCILSDYQMPGMDGMELLDRLRRKGIDTPFIFVTGQGNEEVAREAFKHGAYDYFTKEAGFAHFERIRNSVRHAVYSRRAEERRVLAEKVLAEEKNKLDYVLEGIGDGICILDRDFRILYRNSAYNNMAPSRNGERCYRAVKGRDGVCEGCPVELMFSDGGIHRYETTKRIGVSDREFEITASPLRNTSGDIVAAVKLVKDITERREAEEALVKSEQSFLALSHNLPGIVYRVYLREGNRMRFFNDYIKSMTGYSADELVTGDVCSIEHIMHEDDRQGVWESVVSAIKLQRPFEVDYRVWHRDGGIRRFHEHGMPIYGGDGIPAFIDGVILDVTERMALEKNREDLFAMFRHDMKTPLAMMSGNAETVMIENGGRLDGEARNMLGSIKSNAQFLSRMLDDIMDISRIETGGNSANREPVDIPELLMEASFTASERARAKGMSFEKELHSAPDEAMLERTPVLRALTNLLDNAVKYTPEGGTVKLRAYVSEDSAGKRLNFEVADSGPGIPEKEQGRVFDKYYRLATSSKTKGTGLGLAIVKAVANLHNGHVELDSREGQGSTFTLVMPIE
jgi:PAS domain S-box-containing protein